MSFEDKIPETLLSSLAAKLEEVSSVFWQESKNKTAVMLIVMTFFMGNDLVRTGLRVTERGLIRDYSYGAKVGKKNINKLLTRIMKKI